MQFIGRSQQSEEEGEDFDGYCHRVESSADWGGVRPRLRPTEAFFVVGGGTVVGRARAEGEGS